MYSQQHFRDMLHKLVRRCSAALVIIGASVTAVVVSLVVRPSTDATALSAWQSHREGCVRLPEGIYHRDLARAVRGAVRGPGGEPVPHARIQCISLSTILRLAQSETLSPQMWSNIVEEEVTTDADGQYEFPNLPEGCRVICASATGLAPSVQNIVVTQDGTGARADFTLESTRSLRIRLAKVGDTPKAIHLVPHMWWPSLVACEIAAGQSKIEIPNLGGAFKRGLITVCNANGSSALVPVSMFDLDQADEVSISVTDDYQPHLQDIQETKAILSWHPEALPASRLFFSMLSPVALFCKVSPPSGLLGPPQASVSDNQLSARAGASIMGYGPIAFAPVLIESSRGRAWFTFCSDAAEFEVAGIPEGVYRARALNTFGRLTFARGLVVPNSRTIELNAGVNKVIDSDEPLSREIMGVVRWPDGRPAEKAIVIVQDAANFRRFLRRVTTNANGFFSIPEVPAADYVAFALPPDDSSAMKSFVFPHASQMPREIWLDLSVTAHRIVGRVPRHLSLGRVELVRQEPDSKEHVVWSVTPNFDSRFEISNVPLGRYVVRVVDDAGGQISATSVPFRIAEDSPIAVEVSWFE